MFKNWLSTEENDRADSITLVDKASKAWSQAKTPSKKIIQY